MRFVMKLLLTNGVIIACSLIGRRSPTLGGLLATMPLTTLAVLLWLATDNPGNRTMVIDYTRGVLWGIGPTILFFIATYGCLRRQLPLSWSLAAGGVAWVAGALVHQAVVR